MLHLPADPACEACQAAKIARAPSRRTDPARREVATAFGGRIHCDLIGPVHEAPGSLKHLLVTRDEATEFILVAALRGHSSGEVTKAFKNLYPPDVKIKKVRPDSGAEFT